MKVKRWYTIMLFAAACLAVNCAGKFMALGLQLPLWLDSFGTVLAAYVLGPVCGAMVGMTGNIIYSIVNSWDSAIYALVSAMVGISVGVCAQKGYLKSLFGALSVSFLVTVLSVFISVPLNFRFSGGYTQNIWGDGIIEAMKKIGFNKFFSCCIGQFYLDFLDKVITVLALYLAVKHYGIYKENTRKEIFLQAEKCITACDSVSDEQHACRSSFCRQRQRG